MDPIAFFYPAGHEAHAQPGHPERPERVETIRSALEAAGFWQEAACLPPAALPEAVLAAVHSPAYLQALESTSRRPQPIDHDTYTTAQSWQLALNSAGGAAAAALAVWQGQARRGFALCRPPGHHATRLRGMGFCLLNNAAIAAEMLLAQGAQRLAIVDLDLHHGNGTQDIFWQRPEVFYLSTHQSPYYPFSGALDDTGAGAGLGATANFPLPPYSGDEAFRTVMNELIVPLLDRYNPEMLLVSFGFDPHWRDPLGHLLLSAAEMGSLIGRLTAWADVHCRGRILLLLEGGYDLAAAAACSTAAAAALLGLPIEDPLGSAPQHEGWHWQAMVAQARRLWGL